MKRLLTSGPAARSGGRLIHRMILRNAMLRHGFKPYDSEWWHFTLENEPFPDTYFTFPVSRQCGKPFLKDIFQP